MKLKLAYVCFFILLFHFNLKIESKGESRLIETIYGVLEISDPVMLELINSDVVQRLKKIDQYGLFKDKSFSRYDHSIGVLALLKKFGASREEKITGLLHDASHTVFSHVGDKVFKVAEQKYSYQDCIHVGYLRQTVVVEILKKYNISFDVVNCKCKTYRMLEQDLPNVCIDRLEYNLRGGLVEGLISKEDIVQILADVRFENGRYFFTNMDLAKKFSEIPLYLTENVWGSCDGFVTHVFLAHALLRAVKIGLISLHDIHFSTDDIILKVLEESRDEVIREDVKNCFNSKKLYSMGSNSEFDNHFLCKFRGIDPWIKLETEDFKRLTEVNKNYSQYYNLVKDKMKHGFYIKINQNVLLKKGYLEEVFAV